MSDATPAIIVPPIVLARVFDEQIRREGMAAYPNECCGILIGRDVTTDGKTRRIVERLLPVDNSFDAGEQYHRFSISPRQLMSADRDAGATGQLVLGFYHSHPDHPAHPSQYDLDHGWPFYSYVIVAIEQRVAAKMTCWLIDESAEPLKFMEQTIELG